MSHNNAVFGDLYNAFGYLVKFRGIAKHLAVDARKVDHERLYFLFWVDKAYEFIGNLMAIKTIDGYFCNAFFVEFATGGFYVEYCVDMLFFYLI